MIKKGDELHIRAFACEDEKDYNADSGKKSVQLQIDVGWDTESVTSNKIGIWANNPRFDRVVLKHIRPIRIGDRVFGKHTTSPEYEVIAIHGIMLWLRDVNLDTYTTNLTINQVEHTSKSIIVSPEKVTKGIEI